MIKRHGGKYGEEEGLIDANETQTRKRPSQQRPLSPRPSVVKTIPWYSRLLRNRVFVAVPITVAVGVPGFLLLFALPDLLIILEITGISYGLHTSFFLWAAIQFLYNFFMCLFSTPGVLKSTMVPHDNIKGQYEMKIPDAYKEKLQGLKYAPRFCNFCNHWKAPRSHHCSVCNKCVLRMDHHCPFLFTCIGLQNHGHFLLMHFFSILGTGYMLLMCVWAYWEAPFSNISLPKEIGQLPHLHHLAFGPVAYLITHITSAVILKAGYMAAISTIVSMVTFCIVASMGIQAMWLACKNATTLEYQFGSQSEYAEIGDDVYCPLGGMFFSTDLKLFNWSGLLGKSYIKRFFLPVTCEIDVLELGLEPMASLRGCEQLQLRIDQVKQDGVKMIVGSLDDLGLESPNLEHRGEMAP